MSAVEPQRIRFDGTVFRAHHPRWAFAPISGEGARQRGGRFNPPGLAALYTSLTLEAAWAEAQQGLPAKAQPLTLCQYRVDCSDVLDLRQTATCKVLKVSAADLACAWFAIAHIAHQTPPTWALANTLVALGIAGVIVPSFAPYAPASAANLVLYRWSAEPPHAVTVIDDEQRLPRNDASWRDA